MENTSETLKETVKEKYSIIANQDIEDNAASCCGVGTECGVDYTIFAEDYTKMKGYSADADLALGCGIPTEFAHIKEGDTVLDLGSGAGNDCFIARELTGVTGKIIGVDFTDTMLDKARKNADTLNFNNVEFRKGDIEDLPISNDSIDVIVSNCVLNLVPNKTKAFEEAYRVLKAGGHFSVSDVVTKGSLPDKLRNDAEMYAGCVSGAIELEEYINKIKATGFVDVSIQKKKVVVLPNELLKNYLSQSEMTSYKNEDFGIFSITVFGKKPECGPSCCC
jgi:arsenite methyltransferase